MATPIDINTLYNQAKKEVDNMLGMKGIIYNIDRPKFDAMLDAYGVKTLIEHNDLQNGFEIDEQNKPVIDLLFAHINRNTDTAINPIAGIILNGKYGCGKSVLISAYCKLFGKIYGQHVQEIHSIELAENIRLNGVLEYTRKPLCIQDLGKEQAMVNTYGTTVNPISDLLAIRAEYGSLTFGSTNMNLKSFSDFYKEYIGKRIVEHVNFIFLPGNSRRKEYTVNQK